MKLLGRDRNHPYIFSAQTCSDYAAAEEGGQGRREGQAPQSEIPLFAFAIASGCLHMLEMG